MSSAEQVSSTASAPCIYAVSAVPARRGTIAASRGDVFQPDGNPSDTKSHLETADQHRRSRWDVSGEPGDHCALPSIGVRVPREGVSGLEDLQRNKVRPRISECL